MTNLETALELMQRIVDGDIDGAVALTGEGAVFRGPEGVEMTMDEFRTMADGVKPLLVNPMDQQIVGTTCEGDRVAIEATGRTLLANGKVYDNIYHFLFVVRDGKVMNFREYCNTRATDAFA